MAERALPGQRCAVPLLVRGGTARASGEMLSAGVVAGQVGWLVGLARGLAQRIVEEHWNDADLAALAAGVDGQGRPLPSNAWMAARRLGWSVPPVDADDGGDGEEGSGSGDHAAAHSAAVYVPDRVVRCAQEAAVRTLRSALYRRAVLAAVLASWPQSGNGDPDADAGPGGQSPWATGKRDAADWAAFRAAASGTPTDKVTVRNLTREVAGHVAASGVLPGSLSGLQRRPRLPAQVLLSAADQQLAVLSRPEPGLALLDVKLPTRPDPRTRSDWHRVVLRLPVPAHVPADAQLRRPVLRLTRRPDGRASVHADTAFDRTPAATAPSTGHVRAVGFDWGVRTLLTGAFGWADPTAPGTVRTSGVPVVFDASGVADRLRLLRQAGEAVHRRISRHDDLLRGHDAAGTAPPLALLAKRAVLVEELRRVSAHRRNLDQQLAWAAARWAVDQALAHRATAIYLEDLRTLEAGPKAHPGPGRERAARRNATVSNTVRGRLADAVRHLAGQHGLAVVTVPAVATSRDCPRCLTRLVHTAASDRTVEGPLLGGAWAACAGCGYSAGRDHAAAERVLARGLTTQQSARTARDGTRTVPHGAPGTDTPAHRTRLRRNRNAAAPQTSRGTAPGRTTRTTAGTRVTRPGPAAPPRGAQRPAGRRPSTPVQATGNTTGSPRAHGAAQANARRFPRRARATPAPRRQSTCTALLRL